MVRFIKTRSVVTLLKFVIEIFLVVIVVSKAVDKGEFQVIIVPLLS